MVFEANAAPIKASIISHCGYNQLQAEDRKKGKTVVVKGKAQGDFATPGGCPVRRQVAVLRGVRSFPTGVEWSRED